MNRKSRDLYLSGRSPLHKLMRPSFVSSWQPNNFTGSSIRSLSGLCDPTTPHLREVRDTCIHLGSLERILVLDSKLGTSPAAVLADFFFFKKALFGAVIMIVTLHLLEYCPKTVENDWQYFVKDKIRRNANLLLSLCLSVCWWWSVR